MVAGEVIPIPWSLYPRYVFEPTVTLAIIFDVSGSLDKGLISMLVNDLNNVLREIKPAEIWVFHSDSEVRFVKQYKYPHTDAIEPPRNVPEPGKRKSSAITPPFRYMAEHNINVKNILYFTDLHPTAKTPEEIEKSLPGLITQIGARKVLWLVPSYIKVLDNYWKPNIGKIIWVEPLI